MKILLSGLGSIGNRHLKNLCGLIGPEHIILHRSSPEASSDFPDIPVYVSLEQALAQHTFTHALICSPTALHLKTASFLAGHGVPHIFIEKPLSDSWHDAIQFQKNLSLTAIEVTLGFDLRFDPGLIKVKQLLDDDVIGKVVMVQASVGQFLPDWRPQQDYTKGVSASKAMGGGVILDLIHEVDYVSWLTGPATWLGCFSGKLSDLAIETEDVASITWMTDKGAIVTISLDYLQRKLSRSCKLIGTRGTITWDYVTNKVEWYAAGSEPMEYGYDQPRNDRFIEEMKSFLSPAPTGYTARLSDGLHSLKLALAAKASSENKQMIMIDSFNPVHS
jgi:predicted dehydrogenase